MYDNGNDNNPLTIGEGLGLYPLLGQKLETKVVDMTTEKLMDVADYTDKSDSKTLIALQGACTDGTYVYVLKTDLADGSPNAAVTENNGPDQTRVIKIDPKTKTVVAVGPIISVAHANDLTYNPNTGKLYSAWCSADASIYSVINPDTLNVEKNVDLKRDFFSIAYDSETDRYVLAKSGQAANNFSLIVCDGNLNYVSEFETERFGYTAQGIFCDAKYIYYTQSCRSGLGTKGSIITVHTWDGELVCVMRIDNSDEIESMFWYDDAFYACYQGDADYVAKLVVK